MKTLAMVSLLGLVVVSCGNESLQTSTTVETTTSSSVVSTTTTQPSVSSTTTEATATTTAPAADIVISGGTSDDPEISIEGPDLFSFAIGDGALIRVESSVAGELHLHGYDLYFDLVADGVTEVAFSAEIPGIFEAELEDTHTLVFEIEVTP
jgi:hypothetical protein